MQTTTQQLPNIRQEFRSRNYVGSFEQDSRRQKAIREALEKQRFAFSHFVTITFPQPIIEADAMSALNNGLRTLDSLNQHRIKYFSFLSLDRAYWYSAATEDDTGEAELRTKWHIHLLLGRLGAGITVRQIEDAFRRQCHGFVSVLLYDHDPKLCKYLTDREEGNLIGGLQRTNDRTIRSDLARLGEII